MKKLAIAGMLLASLTALAACDGASAEASEEQRMSCIEHTSYGNIVCDNRTGVMYFVYDDYKAGGVCVMVDQNGKPLVMEENE